MWYVYMLECDDGLIYTGITNNLPRRLKEHFEGKGGHFTSCNKVKKCLYKEFFEIKIAAEQREQQIKRWTKAKKLALIAGDKSKLKNLSKSRDRCNFPLFLLQSN